MVDIVTDSELKGNLPKVNLPPSIVEPNQATEVAPVSSTPMSTEAAPVSNTATSDDRLANIQTAPIDPIDEPEKVSAPVTGNDGGWFGLERNILTDDSVRLTKRKRDEAKHALDYENEQNGRRGFPVPEEVILNKALGDSLVRPNKHNEDKKATANRFNKIYSIPTYENDEEANLDVTLGDGQLYYINPPKIEGLTELDFKNIKVLGKYSTRDFRDRKTFTQKYGPLVRYVVDNLGEAGYTVGKSANAFVRGTIKGAAEDPVDLLSSLYFGFRNFPVLEGANVAVDWAFTLDLLSSDTPLEKFTSRQNYDQSIQEFLKEFNVLENREELKESEEAFKQTLKDFSGWIDDLPAFYGTNTKEYFAGRVGRLFGEELPYVKLLAWIKFRKGLKLAKDSRLGNKTFYEPEELAKALQISVPDAKVKLDWIKNGYTDPKVYALYKLKEMDMALSFATGFSTVNTWFGQQAESGRFPKDSPILSLNYAAEMAAGFGVGSVGLVGRSKNIGSKNSFRLLAVLYGITDALRGPSYKDKRATALLESTQEGVEPRFKQSKIDTFKKEEDRRKYAFLRTVGFSKAEIKQAGKDGTSDFLVSEALTVNELGPNFTKFMDGLKTLPKDQRENLLETVVPNLDSLLEIVSYSQKKGIHIGVYLDDVFDLAALHDAKKQLAVSQGSSWKNMTKALFGDPNIAKQEKNAQILRQQIYEHIKQIESMYGKPELPFDENVREFLSNIRELGEHVVNESEITVLDIAEQMSQAALATQNRQRGVVRAATGSLMPNIGDAKATHGIPILAEENADRSIKLLQKLREGEKEVQDRLWERIASKSHHTFPANAFVDAINDRFFNSNELPELQGILKEALKNGSVSKLIDGMKSRFFKDQDIKSLIDTIAESTRPLDGSAFDTDALVNQITENLNKVTPEGEVLSDAQKFNILAETVEDMGLISNELTMLDIKLLNSHLGKKAISLKSNNPREAYLHFELQDLLHSKVLENPHLDQPDVDLLTDYYEAIKAYKVYADKFLRGTVGKAFRKDSYGDVALNPEEIINELVTSSTVANSKVLENIMNKKPIINEKGKVVDGSLFPEDKKELEELVLNAIYNQIDLGKMDVTSLNNILNLKFYQKILKTRGEDTIPNLRAYLNDMTNKNVEQDNQANAAGKHINEIVKTIKEKQVKNVKGGLLQRISDLTLGDNAAKEIANFFFTKSSFVRLTNLTEGQLDNLRKLFTKTTPLDPDAISVGLKDRISLLFRKDAREQGAGVDVTPFEALYIETEGFTLVKNGRKIGEETLDQLRKILAHGIIDLVYSTSPDRVVQQGKNTLEQTPDMRSLFDLLEISKPLREGTLGTVTLKIKGRTVIAKVPPLFSEAANKILDVSNRATMTVHGSRKFQTSKYAADVPVPPTTSGRMSRVWSWVRGFVGIRWILGEAAISNLRKQQAKGLLEVLTNPNTAHLVARTLDKRFTTPEALKESLGPALRTLSIMTGVTVTDFERWFEDKDNKGHVDAVRLANFWNTGEIDSETKKIIMKSRGAPFKLGTEKASDYLKNMNDRIKRQREELKQSDRIKRQREERRQRESAIG